MSWAWLRDLSLKLAVSRRRGGNEISGETGVAKHGNQVTPKQTAQSTVSSRVCIQKQASNM